MKNILFITQWQKNDVLIHSYTLPYIQKIKQLNVFNKLILIVLNRNIKSIIRSEENGLIFFELPYSNYNLKNITLILLHLKRIIKSEFITNLHPWCTTAGSVAYILKRLMKQKLTLVIDSFEPHAEAMVENGEWKKTSLKFMYLFAMERLQAKYANELITAANGMDKYMLEKYKVKRITQYIKPACVNLELFDPSHFNQTEERNKLNISANVVGIYSGKLGGIYLEDEVFSFIKTCCDYWGDKFLFIFLAKLEANYLNNKLTTFDIPNYAVRQYFVPLHEVPKYLSLANFALCPVKPIPTKRYCTPIKNGEYFAMGLPVVITANISTDSELIHQENIGYVLNNFDTKEYNTAILKINTLILDTTLKLKIRAIAYQTRSFEIAKQIYRAIYE